MHIHIYRSLSLSLPPSRPLNMLLYLFLATNEMEGHDCLTFRELCGSLLRESALEHSSNPRINAGAGACIDTDG